MGEFLTDEQRSAAELYLDAMDEGASERGAALFTSGAVLKLHATDDANLYTSDVLGGSIYSQRLSFRKKKWSCSCTCPVAANCKHCFAAVFYLTESDDGLLEPPRKESDEEKPAKRPKKGDGGFVGIVEGKIDRELKDGERTIAEAVQKIFAQFSRAKQIANVALKDFLGRDTSRIYETHQLWPEPPADVWQAWLYLAHFMRSQRRTLPPFLGAITRDEEVHELVAPWERQQEVERWSAWLTDKLEQPARKPRVEFRARFTSKAVHLETRRDEKGEYAPAKQAMLNKLDRELAAGECELEWPSREVLRAFRPYGNEIVTSQMWTQPETSKMIEILLRTPGIEDRVLTPGGRPFIRSAEKLVWSLEPAEDENGNYRFRLSRPDGTIAPPLLVALDGPQPFYIAETEIFQTEQLHGLPPNPATPATIPAQVVESDDGVALLERLALPLPPRLVDRVTTLRGKAVLSCALEDYPYRGGEHLVVHAHADFGTDEGNEQYMRDGWIVMSEGKREGKKGGIVRRDRSSLEFVPDLLAGLGVKWNAVETYWDRVAGRKFAEWFPEWLQQVPASVSLRLDPQLDTFRTGAVLATVKLDVQEAGVDWFDLRVALDVADTTLTKADIKLLLESRGQFVRLKGKGWRRLDFQMGEGDEERLADLGLSSQDFSPEPQRLHALQLAGRAASKLLPQERVLQIQKRVTEIQTRVVPPLPAGIHAELRPYQIAGFHFLAYLASNNFGGILADDMGLGKTLQTLTWLAWLREQPGFDGKPSLVVCPKSVMDNWRSESARFMPGLRVAHWRSGTGVGEIDALVKSCDLLVVNYPSLRLIEKQLTTRTWHAVILDEAQAIKNPESQTAKAACKLNAQYRLALSGTPIENRLLDLWSIMGFAMPGVLGTRAYFQRTFDAKSDPFARRRLTARVRPFVLRRTKKEVAKDLPDRIEEDLSVELEGEQLALYRAELKRARSALLMLKSNKELDKERFNILTSLLRLRQICCHPALVGKAAKKPDINESAKLAALIDVIEPLMGEGHKVLVFSQFVSMLEIIQKEIVSREWPHYILTGQTEDRGELVKNFQEAEGSAVFLISLKAGGFGLNLTAASYVVLFDPWWNPAVENQAIDRTHRIGQKSKVIAYRLLAKNTIEEKIRQLQRHKSTLASDVLGEENFASALSLEDFRFLLGGDDDPETESE